MIKLSPSPVQQASRRLRHANYEYRCCCTAATPTSSTDSESDAHTEATGDDRCRLSRGHMKFHFAFLVAVMLLSVYLRSVLTNESPKQDFEDLDDRIEESISPEKNIRPWPIMASFEEARESHQNGASASDHANESTFATTDNSALSVVRVNVRIHKPPQQAESYAVRRNARSVNHIEAHQALRVANELRARLETAIANSRVQLLNAEEHNGEENTDSEQESDDTTSGLFGLHSCAAPGRAQADWDAPPQDELDDAAYAYRTTIRRRVEKTRKLLEHAYVLDPESSDVLTALGAFFEAFDGDWVKAEHLYARALTHDPAHRGALANRQRCLPLVAEIDQRRFNRIDAKLKGLFAASATHQHAAASLARTSRERYVRIVYHNNAIEGNSLTLLQTRMLLETGIAIGGKSLREQNEVLGLDSALMFINSTLLRRSGPIRLSDILELHRRVLGYVDLEEAGRLRETQVFIGNHRPPPAAELPDLMRELVDWLNSANARTLHPVELAALAHWKLVYVHPFYDGNGRTSRLLTNWLLMRFGFPPIIVQVQERYKYYRMIELANVGDVRPFIRFMAALAERAIDEFLDSIVSPSTHTHTHYADVADSHARSGSAQDELDDLDEPDAVGTILVDTYQRRQVDPQILDFVGG